MSNDFRLLGEKLIIKIGKEIRYGVYNTVADLCYPQIFKTEDERDEFAKSLDFNDFFNVYEEFEIECPTQYRAIIFLDGEQQCYWTAEVCLETNRIVSNAILSDVDEKDMAKGQPYWINPRVDDLRLYRVTRNEVIEFGETKEILILAHNEIEARDLAVETSENFNFKNSIVTKIEASEPQVVAITEA